MLTRFLLGPLSGVLAASLVLVPAAALACGGGITQEGATIEVDQHVAFYSVREAGVTEVVLQLALPAPGTDFGVIVPVAGEPTLDGEAIEPAELSELDLQTTPQLYEEDLGGGDDGSSSGCGCGDSDLAGGGLDGGGGGSGGSKVDVLQVADIGPITAVSFAADDADALDAWLDENGFSIPAEQMPVVESYIAPGTSFIAFKRNADAPTAGATSVGVHYTLDGDHRTYPLRMAALGGAARIGFRVYVAVPGDVGAAPASPFVTLTLDDLDVGTVRRSYTDAVTDAIALRQGKAFVVEGVYGPETDWRSWLGPRMGALVQSDATLTRLTSVVDAATLDADVDFTGTIDQAPTSIDITSAMLGRPRPVPVQWGAVGISVGALGAAIVRRLRRAVRRS